jgi:hypothetical protein
MRYIKVYINADTHQFLKVPLYFQFYFYHYIPYVLLDDLQAIDPYCVGLFLVDEEKEKIA